MSIENDWWNDGEAYVPEDRKGRKLARQADKVFSKENPAQEMQLYPFPEGHPDAKEGGLIPLRKLLPQLAGAAAVGALVIMGYDALHGAAF